MSAQTHDMICGFTFIALHDRRHAGAKRTDAEQAELDECIARAKRAGIDDDRIASLFDVELSDIMAVMI
ncbi:MAG: hypothetical protein MRY32_04530 [Rickettsiales bacterium]|nr:hypothetical protein [Rickettsiales bacterium]